MLERTRSFKLLYVSSDFMEVLAISEWIVREHAEEWPDDGLGQVVQAYKRVIVPIVEQTETFTDEVLEYKERFYELIALSVLSDFYSSEFKKKHILARRLKLI